MQTDALDGWWWLPDRPEDAVFGRLLAGRSGPWRLDVYGALADTEYAPIHLMTDEMASAPTIHGHLVEGSPGPRFISLLECEQRRANRTFGGAANGEQSESWTFEEIVTGYDTIAGDERGTAVKVRLSNLLEWSGRHRPQVELSDNRASAAVNTIELGRAGVPGAGIELVLDCGATESATRATLRHQAMFRVTPDEPTTFRAAMSDYALPLKALLTFLTLGHVEVDAMDMRLDTDEGERHAPWFGYQARLQRPIDEPKPPLPHEMLATWPDVADMTVEGLVAGWFRLQEDRDLAKAINYLLIPHHAPYLYTDDHLLTAFVATEAYHRAHFDNAVLPQEEFLERVEAVVASAPDEHRDWANRLLRDRNQKGQATKLKEIVERAGTTGQAILAACPTFVKLAIESRNMVAHPGSSGREPGATYLAVSYGLRWMLRHCLLVDLGLDENHVSELIEGNQRFTDERQLVQRWTTAT